jgi:hypothetical protein
MKQKQIRSTSVLTVAYWLNQKQPIFRSWYVKHFSLYELERMANNETD